MARQFPSSKAQTSKILILEAAKVLIARKGFGAVTLQHILDTAQVTKGRFFHYFTSMDDLFSELLHYALSERDFPKFEAALRDCPQSSPYAKLMFLLERVVQWHRRGLPESLRLCVFATIYFSPKSAVIKRISRMLAANSKVLRLLIRDCQKARLLPQVLDCSVLCLLFASAAIGGNTIGFLAGERGLPAKNITEIKKMLEVLHKAKRRGNAL